MTENLNQQQLAAVQTSEGPLLVLAGAGSGKTRVITCRIVYLIDQMQVRPEHILAVTFTNKAAGEMKSRVEAMLQSVQGGLVTASPSISTFHSFCVRVLRRNIHHLGIGYDRNFTIYDADDQARLVKALKKDLGYDDKSVSERQALSEISMSKSSGIAPAFYLNSADFVTDRREKIGRIYGLYEEHLHKNNALDFDDLLIKAVELFRASTDVRGYYHERFRHIMIDEFQDTNGIQYELVRLISTNKKRADWDTLDQQTLWAGRSLCVVGDIDQSIYSWRGADFNIILGFQKDFAGTKMIKLEQNYRSTQTILDAANQVIENNQQRLPKTLYSSAEMGKGEKIRYYQSYDAEGESAFVAEKIHEHFRATAGARCAVLYRTNAQSRLFEEALRRRGIKYNVVGGFSFYERAEVKDIISYLKLAINPRDDIALVRIINTPARGIGKSTLDQLVQDQKTRGRSLWETITCANEENWLPPRAAKALLSFHRLVTSLGDRVKAGVTLPDIVKATTLDTGYVSVLQEEQTEEAQGRLLNIEELVNAAVEADKRGETLLDFIDHAALVADTDQLKEGARVTLLTVHSAKGLEFPVIFLAGLEEGIFPHSRASSSEPDLEEERRLCYVAITRARNYLYVTHAMKRRTFGEETAAEPSRFLNELPRESIVDLSRGPSWFKFGEMPQASADQMLPGSLAYQMAPQRPKSSNYTGETYDSADAVRRFFVGRGKGKSTGESSGQSGSKGPWSSSVPGADSNAPRSHGAVGRGREQGFRSQGKSGSETASGATGSNLASGELKVGARVRHGTYGRGVILGCEGSGEEAKITINFPGYGQKKFIARFLKVERE